MVATDFLLDADPERVFRIRQMIPISIQKFCNKPIEAIRRPYIVAAVTAVLAGALLHTSPLAAFVTELDPRITYGIGGDELFEHPIFDFTSPDPDNVFLNGELGPPDATGRTYHRWLLEIHSENSATVRRITPPVSSQTHSYTATEGLSEEIPLHGSASKVRFRPVVASYAIEGYSRPQKSLGTLAAELATAGARHTNGLIGVGPAQANTRLSRRPGARNHELFSRPWPARK